MEYATLPINPNENGPDMIPQVVQQATAAAEDRGQGTSGPMAEASADRETPPLVIVEEVDEHYFSRQTAADEQQLQPNLIAPAIGAPDERGQGQNGPMAGQSGDHSSAGSIVSVFSLDEADYDMPEPGRDFRLRGNQRQWWTSGPRCRYHALKEIFSKLNN